MESEVKEGFLSAEEARRILDVTDETLRKWSKTGQIEIVRAPGKNTHRRYNVKKFIEERDQSTSSSFSTSIRRNIIYARVSTNGQKENLDRQILMLRERYPDHELITDIASGINFKRKGLKTILDYAIKNELEEVVVAYKERLSRFGFDHFEYLYSKLSNAKIVVLDDSETSSEQELAEDVLSVITVFSAKINGRKKYGKTKESKKSQTKPTYQVNEVQGISFEEAKDDTK